MDGVLSLNKCQISICLPFIEVGGAELAFITLAEELYLRGYSVEILTVTQSNNLDLETQVPIMSLGSKRVITSFFRLRKYMKNSNSVAYYSCLTHLNVFVLLTGAILRNTFRVIPVEVGMDVTRIYKGFFLNRLWRLLIKYAYTKLADTVVAVSIPIANELMERYHIPADRIVVIQNPLRKRLASIEESTFSFPENSGFNLLAVGRLESIKNFDFLLRSFQRAKCLGLKAHLMIVGYGSQEGALRELANTLQLSAEDVTFTGKWLNWHNIAPEVDFMCLCSKSEGEPLVALEALSLGVPLIASDIDAYIEIVREGINGLLFEADNLEAFASAMQRATQISFNSNLVQDSIGARNAEKFVNSYLGLLRS